MDNSLLKFLTLNQIFNQLTSQEIESLAKLVTQEKVPASSYIFLEDEEACHFYLLREGLLRAMIGGKLLASIKPGGLFGEIAVLNKSFRTGSVFAVEDSLIIKIDGKELFEGNSVPVEISYKILKELIKPLVSLHYTNDFYRRTRDLILQGESEKIEFKSTLRYNIHTARFGREIEHAALKSIAAFLNSWGGILLVGVDDNKNITGIEADQFDNDDKAMLHLTNMIKERMGAHFMQFINCSVELIASRKVMRIDVSPSNLPAFLNNNNEEFFYIRTGPSTTELKPSRIYDYIDNRFYRPHA
jgi:CRP-like cAMP-binding protein